MTRDWILATLIAVAFILVLGIGNWLIGGVS